MTSSSRCLIHALLLMTFSVALSAHATTVKLPPPVEDYVEKRLRDCMIYEDKALEVCEVELRRRYKKVPYLSGAQFLQRMAANKNYLKSLSVVSEAQLEEITQTLRALPIDYFEEIDGCMGRAETMSYVLAKKQIFVGNVFARGMIRVESRHLPVTPATIQWGFHVAPFIMVKNANGKIYPYSLDLTLLNGTPRPLNEWLAKLEAAGGSLLELHALKSFESSPTEPGEDVVRSWKDREVSLIEARLREPPYRTIHRGSPLRLDLAESFLKTLEATPLLISNPYERQYEDPEATSFAKSFGDAKLSEIRERIRTELRCEQNQSTECAVYYRDEADHGFCRLQISLPRTEEGPLRVACFPFDR
ncbi:MAG: hypothetical protein KF767_18635 [Bdellovibrionaceae bacterium]|nr:hypothetical protein [Pseudobdellovibrionaceae bacterium]